MNKPFRPREFVILPPAAVTGQLPVAMALAPAPVTRAVLPASRIL
ncbi:MAG: hypothetical protein Q4G22_03230 [Paracoccus sp. (in: a-proteobacteria)]|nr:hypothetical protein [Paracoccus sp. (in: a-proteobacteria)]MDO5630831.1 hypothetical protein [Paracoccus sp. (in: a-proteobacteria)]